jgi:predicted anti-sigma-YlaC factor YlaD
VSCESYYVALHRYADGEGPPDEAHAIEQHLAQCRSCRRTLQLLKRENELLEEHFDTAGVPEGLELRLSRVVPRPARRRSRWVPLAAAAAVVAALVGGYFAIRPVPVATVHRVSGDIAMLRRGQDQWLDLSGREGVAVYDGDQIATGKEHIAAIQLADGAAMEIDVDTSLSFRRPSHECGHRWTVQYGQLHCALPEAGRGFEIMTPAGIVFGPPAGIDLSVRPLSEERAAAGLFRHRAEYGLSLLAPAYAEEMQPGFRVVLTVLRGTVTMSNSFGQRRVPQGTQAEMTSDTPPSVPRSADVTRVLEWARPPATQRPDIEPLLPRPPRHGKKPSAQPPLDSPTEEPAPKTPEQSLPTSLFPPEQVKADVALDAITISWQPGATADKTLWYDVYRSDEVPGAEGEFVRINREPVKGTSYPDKSFSHASSYYYAVVAVGRKEDAAEVAADQPQLLADSYLSEKVKVRAPDFTLVYAGGGSELASIIIRKFHRGYWRPSTFHVAAGQMIGGRRLMRLPDGLGGVEEVDYTTGYRLEAIEQDDQPVQHGTMRIVIADDAGHRYELRQEQPRRK